MYLILRLLLTLPKKALEKKLEKENINKRLGTKVKYTLQPYKLA
jgi:hypothetical protein